MTPQELMDLPGYGSAEKVLRNKGEWKLTPLEMLDKIPYNEDVSEDIERVIAILEEENQ